MPASDLPSSDSPVPDDEVLDVAAADVPATGAVTAPGYQRSDLIKAITIYSLLRFGLFAVLAGIFAIFLPVLIAMAFAVVGQLPLSMLLFPAQKQKVLALMAQGPGAEKAKLRASLRGDSADDD